MKTKDEQRRELVEWSPEAEDLVFRGTAAKLSDFWAALRGPAGMRGFLDQHPKVSAQAARDVLRIAGERFCWWPKDEPGQEQARSKPDLRFEVAESVAGRCSGRLTFTGTRIDLLHLFENLRWDEGYGEHGGAMTVDQFAADYVLSREAVRRAVEIAGTLFEEGLAPDAGLHRRGRSSRGEETG